MMLAKLLRLSILMENRNGGCAMKRTWKQSTHAIIMVDQKYRCGVIGVQIKNQQNIQQSGKGMKREINDVFDELKEKQKDYDVPKLRLWARMIVNGIHESTEEPPNVPLITGVPTKWVKHESVHDVVVDAAKAIAQVFTTSQKGQSPPKGNLPSSSSTVNISPARLADVRMKHYKQLRYLHKLYDDGILSDEEFGE